MLVILTVSYGSICPPQSYGVTSNVNQVDNMTPISDRRKRFKAALALLEETQSAFAKVNDVSLHHLSRVLLGERKSPRLVAAIDAVIARGAAALSTATPTDSQPAATAA